MSFLVPLVLSGPSGVGKGSLLDKLFAEFPSKFGFSVSHTTRSPRPSEAHGKHYYFVTVQEFKQLLLDSAFIEHAEFSGNYYGTSFETVRQVQESGRRCILDIDAQGVRQVKQTALNPVYVFIAPPSISALRARLLGRATESDGAIERRLSFAVKEIDYAKKTGIYDFIIVNDNLDRAYEILRKIALGETAVGDNLPELNDG